MPHFLFLSATNGSNLQLTELLTGFAEEVGATTEIVRLEDLEIPLYTPTEKERSGIPQAAHTVTQKLLKSDALILIAPEYNGSIPPVVTNLIAWMSVAGDDFRAAFNGRFSAVGTHSGGSGFKVIEAMRSQLNHLGMIVLARTFATSFSKQQNPDSARAIFKQLIKLSSK